MPTSIDVVVKAIQTCCDGLDDPTLIDGLRTGRDVPLHKLQLESLDRFEVIMQIETALDIEVDDSELVDVDGVLGIVDVVDRKRA